jgi:thioredoxin-related protein
MMKRIFASLVLLALAVYAEQDWLHSYEEGKTLAMKENKLVLVMLSKEGCDACWYMENIVFEDSAVNALLVKNFVPVYLDIHQDTVPEQFKYIGTPAFYFTDAQGQKIGHVINGASNVKDFMSRINTVLQEAKK